ncbi:cell wall-binding repeat-containing protein [Euzebya sp.]|uniref:cell wall-binding repeat-containing protein n=1 Tax=Euzebya sp. TaxID=1971409 RepID=UPI0035132D80
MAVRRPAAVWGAMVLVVLAASTSMPAAAQVAPAGEPPQFEVPDRVAEPGLTEVLTAYAAGEDRPNFNADGVTTTADISGVDLITDGRRLVVEVSVTDTSPATLDGILAAGAEITHVAAGFGVVSAWVAPADLRDLAAVDGVTHVREALAPQLNQAAQPKDVCPTGIDSEADQQLRADAARTAFGVDGRGVEVGVLSDSFDTALALTDATRDVLSGDLPGAGNPCGRTAPVDVVAEGPTTGTIDEGRAMLQHVHDLAPATDLAFATAFSTQLQFADHIRALRSEGADVIVDDVTYFAEPVFQEGPIAVAVSDVVADGAVYLSSAGNGNVVLSDGREVGSYEAPALRPAACPFTTATYTACHDFNPDPVAGDSTFGVAVAPGRSLSLTLQWAEPWDGLATDFDLFVFDQFGALAGRSIQDNFAGSPTMPFERVVVQNTTAASATMFIVVARFGDGAEPRLHLNMGRSGIVAVEYDGTSGPDVMGPTIVGHNGGVDTISVAATDVADGVEAEAFSSRGPVTHHFGPVRDGGVPAEPLATPLVLVKPDLTASDGACTTYFGSLGGGCYRFFGTSAAAPHAAAVAALVRDAAPDMSSAQVADLLRMSAAPMVGGPHSVGAGLVDAHAALDALRPTGVTATPGPGSATVAWTPPPVEPGPVVGYRIRVHVAGAVVDTIDVGDVTTADVRHLDETAAHTVTVAALTASGEVLPSDHSSPATPLAATAPGAPTAVVATPGDGRAQVAWTPPADDGGAPITGWVLRADDGTGVVAEVDALSSPATMTGLTNGTSHTVTVAAVNAKGEGAASAPSAPVTPFRPAPIGGGGGTPPTEDPDGPPDPDEPDEPEPLFINLRLDDGDAGDPGGGGSETSIAFSELAFPSAGAAFAQAGPAEALLASEQVFADALASGSLQDDRPLLLTDPSSLEPAVLAELRRLDVTTVRILGGEDAVAADVATALVDAGFDVVRTAGATRLETAAEIAGLSRSSEGFVARAFPSPDATDPTQAFADALALGAWAAVDGAPILLSQSDQLSTTTAEALGGLTALRIIGGTGALGRAVEQAAAATVAGVERIAGATRFDTATAIATARGFSPSSQADAVIVIEGQSPSAWTAGFTAAALSARWDAPVVLANGDDLPSATERLLRWSVTADADVVCVADATACAAALDIVRD